MGDLLFYTAADREYEYLTPLFIYFSLSSTKNSKAEIGLEDSTRYIKENQEQYRLLNKHFGDRFKLSTVDFSGVPPGAVRFLTTPVLSDEAEYVYITDIDILIMEDDIVDKHTLNMYQNDAGFSNKIRPSSINRSGTPRLTGVHFAPTNLQYPLPNFEDLFSTIDMNFSGADEQMLYKIMDEKGKMISTEMGYRPLHGIHVSTNHHPFGDRPGLRSRDHSFEQMRHNQKFGWSGLENPKYRRYFLDKVCDDGFQELYFELDIRAKNLIMILENACEGRFDEFEEEAMTYIVSKYFNKKLVKRKLSRGIVGDIYRALR